MSSLADLDNFDFTLLTEGQVQSTSGDGNTNEETVASMSSCDCLAHGVSAEQERDVNVPGGGHNLRNYWVHGPGAAKIGWGTDGSFARCVGFLGEHVKNPEGLCAEYHKQATGEWPAEKGIPSEGDTVTLETTDETVDAPDVTVTAADSPKEPYGDVPYADPGYQEDGVKRYPLDTEAHVRAAWSYINVQDNADKYSRSDLRRVRARIAAAMRKLGVKVEAALDSDLVAAAITGKDITKNEMDDVYAPEILELEVTPVSSASWQGVLTVEGVRSGDARMFALDSLVWDKPPLPLMWQKETSHGGDNNVSVRVGSIDRIWREPAGDGDAGKNLIMGSGTLDLGSADGREVFRRMRDGYMGGNSVDVDSVTDSDVELEFPKPGPNSSMLNVYAKPSLTTYKCGRIRATTMVEIPAFTEARLALVDVSDVTMPIADTEQVSRQITDIVAATNVFEISDVPPREWFNEPTDVTPQGALTVTTQGRVYGYIAPANVRHRSFPDRSTYVPMRNVDYSRFMSSETIVSDGSRITTGRITMNCGHATTRRSLTASQASEHYDNSCSIVARVRVGENKHGVWVAGALLPDVPPATIQRMMACSLSGDWRGHLDRPGWREFVAALLVPVPGFPMARRAPSVNIVDGELVSSCVPVMIGRPDGTFNGTDTVESTAQDDTEFADLVTSWGRRDFVAALSRRVAVARLRSTVSSSRGSSHGMQLRKKSGCAAESGS